MVTCPFCVHPNEEGTRYCVQCKTDLLSAGTAKPGGSPFGQLPLLSAVVADAVSDVPTLQLNKVPLVENLRNQTAAATPPLIEREPVPESPQTVVEALTSIGKPQLVVVRGQKIDTSYPLYIGKNYLGRTDEKPVDIDLEDQEPADRIWTSRQHAVVSLENGVLTIEDLNSLNGTFVNRTRVHPGQVRTLQADDTVIVGTIHLRVVLG